ncbi:glycosyltransferase 61 family protein [Gluconobacter cerinus]|uniref:glycosyltransferase 61 family protein n=1 Tax=Gluconobacter cerinus TaxID=38307 RepID=UPI001B8C1824|nr:glycosyltransferase family 61 protein [Gluconobacter cerinus]MBS0984561.1 glycosyltransferase family 61 protein [Gluconobacter cerinus]
MSSTLSGGLRCLDTLPHLRIYNEVIVDGWQLYDAQRNFITASGYMRGERRDGTNKIVELSHRNVTANPLTLHRFDQKKYVWIGHIHGHFGHFLLSTTSRMWFIRNNPKNDFTFVGVCDEGFFEKNSPLKDFMTSVGITSDNFLNIRKPSVFSELHVPEPAFVESGLCYREWGAFMGFASERIRGSSKDEASSNPVYITKHRLTEGVRTLVGEDELCERLEGRGFSIVSPENLTLQEQAHFWQRHPTYVSFRGSALHGAAFTTGKNIVSLHSNSDAQESQYLVDKACENRGIYINASEFMSNCQPPTGFGSASKISSIEDLECGICRIVDRLNSDHRHLDSQGNARHIYTKMPRVPSVDALGVPVPSSYKEARPYELEIDADEGIIIDLHFPVFVTEIRLFVAYSKELPTIRFVGCPIIQTDDERVMQNLLSRQAEEASRKSEGEDRCFRLSFTCPQHGNRLSVSIYGGRADDVRSVEVFGVVDEFELAQSLGL